MYKGPMDSVHLYTLWHLDFKLCHNVQTGMYTMETCIRVSSIRDVLKYEEWVLKKDVAVAVTGKSYMKLHVL
jgi:hypothetical protein